MTNRSFLALALIVLSFAASTRPGSAQRQPNGSDDRAAIARLIEQVQAANNAGAVEQWVSLFADDFVYMAPGIPPVTTRNELLDIAKMGFRNETSVSIEPLEMQVFGNWAFARTKVAGTVKLHESGNVVQIDTKQIVIYSKDDQGLWRIARLISNSNK